MVRIERLLVGTPRELVDGEKSAIWKETVSGPLHLGELGLDGDHHVYQTHGGADKALFHYAAEHYRMWADRFPSAREASGLASLESDAATGGPVLPPRTLFGENIVTFGMREEDVCLGDRYRIGETVVVEVSQSRQPCWKLGFTSGAPEVPALMQETASTGWYYRVIASGPIAPHDPIVRESRPLPEWSLARIIRAFYGTPDDRDVLEELLGLSQLSTEFRAIVEKRLATGVVEDWNGRLYR